MLRDIINGWWNYIFHQLPNAKERFATCKKCKSKKWGVCTECGCICVVKSNCQYCKCEKWSN